MPDFLLELFSEEIPARMQPAAAAQLAERFSALLAEVGLSAGTLEAHATPRRLALIATGLPAASAATSEERRGPRADAPAPAIEGFLKSTGLARAELEERDTGKGVFLFAQIGRQGRPAAAILAEKLPALITGFQWPKSQRWGAASASTASPRWVRPLRGIVALLDSEVIPFEALGLTSGRTTWGHRFMGPKTPLLIDSPASYAVQLRAAFVLLSAEERQQAIRAGATAATAAGLHLRPDAGLEAENAGLTEWPVPLLGRFDPAFLDVPAEIIALTMRTNQKYFALSSPPARGSDSRNASGGGVALNDECAPLAPAFVCVANLAAPDGGATIAAGNERVLSARLSDARFFWEQDKAVPLETHAEKLKDIVFHEKLGTMAEKVERVAKLARWLVESGAIPNPVAPAKAGAPLSPSLGNKEDSGIPAFAGMTDVEFADTVERAARLAKADLTTGTVGEFPELQGIIGGYLAEAQGEPPAVVAACKQHHAAVPAGAVAVAVALADRLDTLAAFFMVDERPTGSRDPQGLRRAGISIIKILTDYGIRTSLFGALLGPLIKLRRQLGLPAWEAIPIYYSDEIRTFILDRIKVQQREAGVRHDLIDAVFALGGEDDLVRLLARVKALQAFIETEDGANLLAGYKRAANILRIEEKKDGRAYALDLGATVSTYIGETEKNLARLFVPAEEANSPLLFDEADALLAREDFEGAMRLLATLRAPVDRFFEEVTVNDPDPDTRARRLGLLAGIRDAMHKVADFSKIEG